MLLSVVSALARLDVDPWQEAATLAGMPTEIATKRLTALIVALPGLLSAHLDSGKIAARLTALLPARASAKLVSREIKVGGNVLTKADAFVYFTIFVMTVLLSVQFLAASRQSLSSGDAASSSSTSRTVSPPLYVGQ